MVKDLAPKRYSAKRAILILLLGIALPALIAYQLGLPIRMWASDRFVMRGDAYLAARQFDQAQAEYRRASRVYDLNAAAVDRLSLATVAATDPRVARSFFAEQGNTSLVRMIDEATEQFVTPKAALTKSIELAEVGEYALARYPVETALTLDAKYPEAWHQAYLVYEKLAELDARFRPKADSARAARDALSPNWLLPTP